LRPVHSRDRMIFAVLNNNLNNRLLNSKLIYGGDDAGEKVFASKITIQEAEIADFYTVI